MEELSFNGETVKGNEATRQGAKLFFQNLYSDEEGCRPRLDGLDFKQLCGESKMGVEVHFTAEEFRGCLDECNGEKAPGPDGFNMKFYQV